MLQRLQASIDRGDVQIIDMHAEGGGEQVLELFMRPAEKVLQELMADLRLAGCQHFAFHEYKERGNRLFAGYSKYMHFIMYWSWMALRWQLHYCVMSTNALCALVLTVSWIELMSLTHTATPNP